MKLTEREDTDFLDSAQEVAMAHLCSNCDRIFDHSGKYCSERCARNARKYRQQVLLAAAVGLLAIIFANYTAPIQGLHSERRPFLSASKLHQLAATDECSGCACKDKADGKFCIAEKVSRLRAGADSSRFRAQGWILCMVCQGTCKLREALNLKMPLNRT
jgi:hypothetical protein